MIWLNSRRSWAHAVSGATSQGTGPHRGRLTLAFQLTEVGSPRRAIGAVLLLLLARPGAAAQALPSTSFAAVRSNTVVQAFPWDGKAGMSRRPANSVHPDRIEGIVAALKSTNRDAGLASLGVPRHVVDPGGGEPETWWDLRGADFTKQHDLEGANLTRLALDDSTWNGVRLADADLGGALLRGALLEDCNLRGAQLDGALLDLAELKNCDLTDANLRTIQVKHPAVIKLGTLNGTRFDGAHADGGLTIAYCHGAGTSFRYAVLDGLRVVGGEFSEASLLHAKIRRSTFDRCKLGDADFSEADMAEASFQGVSTTGTLRLVRARIGGVRFGDLRFDGADIRYLEWPAEGAFLGEEQDADTMLAINAETLSARGAAARLYSQAEAAYRYLSKRYKDEGYLNEAILLRYRALETRRKLLALERRHSPEAYWLAASGLLSGHGCRPRRLVLSFLLILAAFLILHLGLDIYQAWRERKTNGPPTPSGTATVRRNRLRLAFSTALGGLLGPAGKVLELAPLLEAFSPPEDSGAVSSAATPRSGSTPHRILVAIEAFLGLLLLWLAFRTALTFTSL